MSFETIWLSIKNHEGEDFRTVLGLRFTYRVENDYLTTTRTDYPISIKDFEKAYSLKRLEGPGQLANLVRGPSYVFAILTDKRIQGE